MDRGAWWATAHRVADKESDKTEATRHARTHFVTKRLVLQTTLKVKQYSVEDSREETDLPKCF